MNHLKKTFKKSLKAILKVYLFERNENNRIYGCGANK